MVQYKKDEIKEKIDNAALSVFSEKGFINAKIADIATKAGVSVGNIYRYYKTKDELFYTIMPEKFADQFKNFLFEKITSAKENGLSGYKGDPKYNNITKEFYQFMLNNRERFIILIEHGQGTRYSDFRRELVDFFTKTFIDNFVSLEKGSDSPYNDTEAILNIVYDNVINMFSAVLKQNYSGAKTKRMFQAVNSYHLAGVSELAP